MTKPIIAARAKVAADSAQAAAEEANAFVAAAQKTEGKRIRDTGLDIGVSLAAWKWVEYAEQSARRAKEYARQAASAAQAHNIPEANRRLRNAESEANGAWSNAERAGVTPRHLRS